MLAKPFDRNVAKSLLNDTGTRNYWKINDQGVRSKKSKLGAKPDFKPDAKSQLGPTIDKEFDDWKPVHVFALDENAPNCANTPALSFPFDARDLAAFMLYGNGCLIAEYYGGWENGPDSEKLDALLPDNFARCAVKEAFEAYREALKVVGPYPLELDAKAERARKAWNDADSETDKEMIAALDLEMEATAAEAKAAQGKWLEAMVRALLKPVQKSKLDVTTNVPVVVDEIDFKMMATRTQLIDAFGNFTGMDMSWFNNLNDVPKLKAARKFLGKSGRHSVEPLFCPYAVMQWLADPRRKKGRKLSNEKAWSLLKGSFPSVYDQYSIGDPNND